MGGTVAGARNNFLFKVTGWVGRFVGRGRWASAKKNSRERCTSSAEELGS